MTGACERLHVEGDWADALRQAGLDSFDALYEAPFAGRAYVHDRARTGRLALPDGRTLFLKCAAFTSLKQIAADVLRLRRPEPTSQRERRGLLRVAEAGISAPRPVAWGQRRRCGLPWRGVLAMTLLGGVALDEHLASAEVDARAEALEAVGRTLKKLYQAGLSWPDLRVKHIFVDAGPSVGLLDLERLEPRRGAAGRRTTRQVARFCAELRQAGADEGGLAAMLQAMGRPDLVRGGSGGR